MNKAAYQFPGLVVSTLVMAWTSSVAHAGPPTDTLKAKQAALYELLRQPHRNPRKINAIARHGFFVLLRKLESQVADGRDPF